MSHQCSPKINGGDGMHVSPQVFRGDISLCVAGAHTLPSRGVLRNARVSRLFTVPFGKCVAGCRLPRAFVRSVQCSLAPRLQTSQTRLGNCGAPSRTCLGSSNLSTLCNLCKFHNCVVVLLLVCGQYGHPTSQKAMRNVLRTRGRRMEKAMAKT